MEAHFYPSRYILFSKYCAQEISMFQFSLDKADPSPEIANRLKYKLIPSIMYICQIYFYLNILSNIVPCTAYNALPGIFCADRIFHTYHTETVLLEVQLDAFV